MFEKVLLYRISAGISRYTTQKNWRNRANRLELCPYCYKHTIHETIKK
nr:ribosomal protein L3 [Serissa japonica]UZM09044.1 ribosomal protein L3 [Serissa japonica]